MLVSNFSLNTQKIVKIQSEYIKFVAVYCLMVYSTATSHTVLRKREIFYHITPGKRKLVRSDDGIEN